MQQVFHTRNYSIRDFEEWDKRGELVLQPKFQRRPVWSDKARSYLIDTILRGKPIPKVYMRQDVNPKNRKAIREIVDGQQRLHTELSFLRDGFKISRAHHADFGGKTFSDLNEDTQRDILKYEFVVDLLQDMPDSELFNVFARINTFSERLKPQELRNAQWFGDVKSCVYQLSEELTPFFIENKILSQKRYYGWQKLSTYRTCYWQCKKVSKRGQVKRSSTTFTRNTMTNSLHEGFTKGDYAKR